MVDSTDASPTDSIDSGSIALALKFLGIDQIGIIITKVDLVDDDLLELLSMELDEWLESFGW